MAKYRKRPVTIEAIQWFKNGDHPEDNCETFMGSDGKPFQGEGHMVRYYRLPTCDGKIICKHCGHTMHDHGWIDTPDGGHTVCPGNWIITGVNGEKYLCKPINFEATNDPVVDEADVP